MKLATCDDARKLIAYSCGLVLYTDNYVRPWHAISIRALQMLIPILLQAACQRLHSSLPVRIAQPAQQQCLQSQIRSDRIRSYRTIFSHTRLDPP